MSYILEALKKSEQERNPDKVPDLSTQHQGTVSQGPKGFPWAWVISVVIVLNVIFWYVFLFQNPFEATTTDKPLVGSTPSTTQKSSEAKSELTQEVTQEAPKIIAVEKLSEPEVKVAEQTEQETGLIGSKSKVQQEEQVIQTPVIQTEFISGPTKASNSQITSGYNDLPHISELPMSLQQQIPNLSFTTHIYVRDGGSFVIINNISLSDGMSLGSGLVLESIVKEGVILSYRNRRFTLRSMESWTAN